MCLYIYIYIYIEREREREREDERMACFEHKLLSFSIIIISRKEKKNLENRPDTLHSSIILFTCMQI